MEKFDILMEPSHFQALGWEKAHPDEAVAVLASSKTEKILMLLAKCFLAMP
jgi:hypothetical protein